MDSQTWVLSTILCSFYKTLSLVSSADLTTPSELILLFLFAGEVEDELLHAYSKVYTFDTPLLMVRLAVLVAVTLTVPIVLFPVSIWLW